MVWLLGYEVAHLSGYAYGQSLYPVDGYDEGVYVETGALVAHGFVLYRQIYSAQPPLLPDILALMQRAAGVGMTQGHVTILLMALALLGAVAWIGWQVGGPIAGGAGAALLAVSPEFLVYSHAVEEELPMSALCAVSLGMTIWWLKKGRRDRLGPAVAFGAGAFWGLAVLTKFFAFSLVLPLALILGILFWTEKTGRRAWIAISAVLLFVAGAASPIGLSLLSGRGAELRQMIGDRVSASAHAGGIGAASNHTLILQFVETDPGLFILAVAGGLALLALDRIYGLILGSWLVACVLALLAYRPLFGHHPVILLAPAAALAGAGIGGVAQAVDWAVRPVKWPPVKSMSAAIIGIAGILYVCLLPRLVHGDGAVFVSPANDSYSRAVATAARIVDRRVHRGPIATSDASICIEAHLLCVPDLVDTSYVRVETGKLTGQEAIAAIRSSEATAVVLGRALCPVPHGKYPRSLVAWIQAHYRLVRRMPNLQGTCGGVYIR
jgi:4-amino-4-deoxy-L-arabinose transferase-like glycosyltransferase